MHSIKDRGGHIESNHSIKDHIGPLWIPMHIAQCAFWELRWPCGQNGPVYATGPYYVAHVVDTGP